MLVSFVYPMRSLKRERQITVYLPDDYYQQKRSYPVMYINDGQNAYFDCLSFCGVSWGFLDYVQDHHLDIIMVAIPCNFEEFKRMDEYGPWVIDEDLAMDETNQKGLSIGGEGQVYIEWLKDDLKPYIDKRFRTIQDDTAIVGSSMGGVISAYAGLAYPQVFKKCACLSTAFWFYMNEFEELIDSQDYDNDFKFYFDLGEFEGCGNEKADEWYPESNARILELLEKKVEKLRFYYFEGEEHNEAAWRKRVPLFMEFFYEG